MMYSQAVPKFLKTWEGLRLTPYQDSAGLWTVGFGHLLGKEQPDMGPITEDQAYSYLLMDLDRTQQGVNELTLGLGVRQCEFDALCCFVYNIGVEAFRDSTMLLCLKQGDHNAAADQFSRWDHVDGQVVPGLLSRRLAERTMFLGAT